MEKRIQGVCDPNKGTPFIGEVHFDSVRVPVYQDRDSMDRYGHGEWSRPVLISVTRMFRFSELGKDLREEMLDQIVVDELNLVLQPIVDYDSEMVVAIRDLGQETIMTDGLGKELLEQFLMVFNDDELLYELSANYDSIVLHPDIPEALHPVLAEYVFQRFEDNMDSVKRDEIEKDLEVCWFSEEGVPLDEDEEGIL